jgi:DNA polymerase-3 subunit beta
MHFIINRNDFLLAISTVEKFVPSKSPLTILSGIKFEVDETGSLHLSATDENMGIRYTVENKLANLYIEEKGSAVIPAKLLTEMMRKLPSGNVEFRKEKHRIYIVAGDFKMVLPCLDASDFPEILTQDLPKVLTYSQKTFKDMLKKTLFARAEETTSRPQLTGVLLELKNSVLNAVALDGYRIAWRWEKLKDNDDNFYIIVPGPTVMEIVKVFSDGDETFDLRFHRNRVEFATDHYVISSRVLEGAFIDYEKVVATTPNTLVKISTDDMLSAVERANLIAREGNRNSLFHMNISQVALEVEADSELGSIKDRHQCHITGDSLQISFNARFFIEALRALESEEVSMSFSGDTGPCIMKPVGEDNYINYVLPVKTRRGDSY